ncbi:MAG: hypothetical protein LW823_01110 [Rickettsiales bacterium]|jgi:hypothetical protein|nr:hypothetical protein [Rickettsiales bacterium]
MYKLSLLKKISLVLVFIALLGASFLAGAYQHRTNAWPFGRGMFSGAYDTINKEQIEKQKQAILSADSGRHHDLAGNSFTDPAIIKKQLLRSNNSLSYLYDDLPFMMVVDPSYCAALETIFIKNFSAHRMQCFRIYYQNFEFDTYVVRIFSNTQTPDNKKLIIYNHGHDGHDAIAEYARIFLHERLAKGTDLLITSMPLTGFNNNAGRVFNVKTHDGVATWDFKKAQVTHELFEFLDTGRSHYMRFFIDSAVLPMLHLKDEYNSVSYLGLSGGSATGLPACNVLKDRLAHCILIAGLLPTNLRSNYKTVGHAEEISTAYYSKNPVMQTLRELSESRVKVHMIYNDEDDCCFDKESAVPFKELVKREELNIDFRIVASKQHGYNPDMVANILDK